MKFLSELNSAYSVTSISQPLAVTHKWVFGANKDDFFLTPITYLSETTGPSLKLKINEEEIALPISWYIVVVDPNTYQVDTIPVSSCGGAAFEAFLFSPDNTKIISAKIQVVDFLPEEVVVHPEIERCSGLCVSVGKTKTLDGSSASVSVIATPYDLYKWLNGKFSGDFI